VKYQDVKNFSAILQNEIVNWN